MSIDITSQTYEIVEKYRGTCIDLTDEDLNWLGKHDQCTVFDDQIFMCEDCGWWCEDSENVGDSTCTECNLTEDGDWTED